jgi:hypothetical protein
MGTRLFICLLALGIFCPGSMGQDKFNDSPAQFLVNGQLGSQVMLGYDFPASAFGPSVEVPIESRFEVDAAGMYSPDHKPGTDDDKSLVLSGSVLGYATERLGFTASLERSWLWTTQFNESAWGPSAGVVIKNDIFGPGRLFLTYLIPTGCVWATPTNPCTLQSKRLQGGQFRQEIRAGRHARAGIEGGLYHFCDQANQNEPQTGRRCHMAAVLMLDASFTFHF